MEVILVGNIGVDRELIKQLAIQLSETSINVVNALEVLVVGSKYEIIGTEKEKVDIGVVDFEKVDKLFDSFPIHPIPVPKEFLEIGPEDESSWIPRHGYFCEHWYDYPCIIYAALMRIIILLLTEYGIVRFHRKCFMQLKVFVNFRFER